MKWKGTFGFGALSFAVAESKSIFCWQFGGVGVASKVISLSMFALKEKVGYANVQQLFSECS